MNKTALAFALNRLNAAPNKAGLRAVWESFSLDTQRHPDVRDLKDRLKAEFDRVDRPHIPGAMQ